MKNHSICSPERKNIKNKELFGCDITTDPQTPRHICKKIQKNSILHSKLYSRYNVQ